MDMKTLLEKTLPELQKELARLRAQMQMLQARVRTHEEKNVRKLRALKKDIARTLTVINKKRKDT